MKVLVFRPNTLHNGHQIESASISKDCVPVYIDFNNSLPPVGWANLSQDENGCIYAELAADNPYKGFYPAIGGDYRNNNIEIGMLGICRSVNTDPNIKQL